MKRNLLFIITLLLTTSTIFASINLPKGIVNAQWLSENIDNVKILDVRKEVLNYTSIGHIDGAVLVNAKDIRVTRQLNGKKVTRLIPLRENFDKLIASYGMNYNDTIIITHEGDNPGGLAGAARLYWQFKVYGFNNVAILDGGNKAWVNDAMEDLVKTNTSIKAGNFKTTTSDNSIIVYEKDVLNALKNNSHTLVDTRDMRFHIGLSQKKYVYAKGHIPTSKNLFYKFLTPRKGTMKYLPIKKVKEAFVNMQIDPMSPIILYCNSAYECSTIWVMVHELMGNKNISVYDGGLHEWTMNKNNPMVTTLGK